MRSLALRSEYSNAAGLDMRCVICYIGTMSVGQFVRIFGIFAAALAIGCTSTGKVEKLSCDQKDWYELGRADGAKGATLDKFAAHKADCGDGFNAFWETMYTNGRNAGLVEFCAPENSYEMGRMGVAYHYVCPSTMEAAFLEGYRRGQQARELEIANQKLDAEIDELIAKLTQAGDQYEKRQIASELDDLRKTRAKNERALESIDN